jgi:hypothetical protein
MLDYIASCVEKVDILLDGVQKRIIRDSQVAIHLYANHFIKIWRKFFKDEPIKLRKGRIVD